VEKIKIVDAHPAGVFDQSAIQSISTWRFNPGTVEGVAVSTLATQILKFELAK
jgi:protein TonB